jgi:hypothetical protein
MLAGEPGNSPTVKFHGTSRNLMLVLGPRFRPPFRDCRRYLELAWDTGQAQPAANEMIDNFLPGGFVQRSARIFFEEKGGNRHSNRCMVQKGFPTSFEMTPTETYF